MIHFTPNSTLMIKKEVISSPFYAVPDALKPGEMAVVPVLNVVKKFDDGSVGLYENSQTLYPLKAVDNAQYRGYLA